jgi:hypothetical protein
MILPSKEHILALQTTEECESLIRKLDKEYKFSKTVVNYTDDIDRVVNTLVLLDFRIKEIQTTNAAIHANECKLGRSIPLPKIKPTPKPRGKTPRKFRVLDTVYESIFAAALSTGIKLNTLKTYVSRKADRYGYIEEENEQIVADKQQEIS